MPQGFGADAEQLESTVSGVLSAGNRAHFYVFNGSRDRSVQPTLRSKKTCMSMANELSFAA